MERQSRKKDEHVADDPLFVLKVTASGGQSLDKLRQGLLECHGTVLVEVNEGKKEVRVRGNIKPLDLLTKTHAIMGDKAKLSYYNKDPARIHDFKIRSNGKEKEEEDHYKPYVYKEHKPVKFPSSMTGKEFFDYFRGAGSETHKRNAVPTVDPSSAFPDYSHMVDPYAGFPDYSHMVDPYSGFPDYFYSNQFNSPAPMLGSPYPPQFF